MGYIYSIQNTLNSKCYVGQSTELDIYTRWRNHFKNNSNCRYLKNALNKNGKDAFKFQIICICFDEDLNRFEEEYMKSFNSSVPHGYNLRAAGNHGKHHEETKAKISKTLTGRKLEGISWHKGKTKSDEQKRKISEKLKGVKKVITENHLAQFKKQCKKVIQYDIDMNKITEFESCTAAAHFTNNYFSQSNISRACLKNTKYKGFIWKYEKDIDN